MHTVFVDIWISGIRIFQLKIDSAIPILQIPVY